MVVGDQGALDGRAELPVEPDDGVEGEQVLLPGVRDWCAQARVPPSPGTSGPDGVVGITA